MVQVVESEVLQFCILSVASIAIRASIAIARVSPEGPAACDSGRAGKTSSSDGTSI